MNTRSGVGKESLNRNRIRKRMVGKDTNRNVDRSCYKQMSYSKVVAGFILLFLLVSLTTSADEVGKEWHL